jgi:hypothetical protein
MDEQDDSLIPQPLNWLIGVAEATIRAVVNRSYALAREDDTMGLEFRNAVRDEQWHAYLDTITDFCSSMLLGSGGIAAASAETSCFAGAGNSFPLNVDMRRGQNRPPDDGIVSARIVF